MRKELQRIFLWMPEDAEACVAAIAVCQSLFADLYDLSKRYEQMGANGAEVTYLTEMYFPNQETKFLSECLGVIPPETMRVFVIAEPPKQSHEYDLIFRFDMSKAYQLIRENPSKHLVQAFGILVGTESASLPVLNTVSIPGVEYDFLLLPFTGAKEVLQMVQDNLQGAKATVLEDLGLPLEQSFYEISRGDVVVGPRSAYTYLAAAAGRGVIELYDENEFSRDWLSKFESTRYRMIAGKGAKSFVPSLVFRAMEASWTTTQANRASQTQTEPLMSFAKSAPSSSAAPTTGDLPA